VFEGFVKKIVDEVQGQQNFVGQHRHHHYVITLDEGGGY
jgi:phospholipase C